MKIRSVVLTSFHAYRRDGRCKRRSTGIWQHLKGCSNQQYISVRYLWSKTM